MEIVQRTRHKGQYIALTFDDGPSEEWTPRVLKLLRDYDIKATFCLVGDEVNKFPRLVRRIVNDGHTLCNHTMHHANLQDWTSDQIRADLLTTNRAIRSAVPDAEIPYYRAPYGLWGVSPSVAASLGMTSLGWSVDSTDWSRPGTEKIVQTVRDQLRPMGVVLMHDAGEHVSQTVAALQTLIPELEEKGWRFDLPMTT